MSIKLETIYSKYLQKDMSISLYIPNGYEDINLPVLYFLHGRNGDEKILTQLGIDKVADDLIKQKVIKPLIVVCPNMDNSRGINSSDKYSEVCGKYGTVHKGMYEGYFIEEVIPHIDAKYKTLKNRNSRYIGGISAGGYTALHNGFRHPDLFSKVGGHMPAIDMSYADEDECYFSDEKMWEKYDPITLSKEQNIEDLQVYLDDGDQDEGQFYLACEKLYELLRNKNVNVENHVFKGHHDRNYVMSNLKSYLQFYGS